MTKPAPAATIRARITALLCVVAALPLVAGFAAAVPAGHHATGRTVAMQPVTTADIAALKLAMEQQ